jgi:hypothetical protein
MAASTRGLETRRGGVDDETGDTSGLETRAGRVTSGPGVARLGREDSVLGQMLSGVRAYFTHPHRELRTARRTWWAGFCGLPLLWMLNWLNFRKAAQEPDALTELKVLVRMSLFLFSVALSALGAWLAYFQTVTDTMVCPCDGPFGSDWRSVCPEAAPSASHHVAIVLRCVARACRLLCAAPAPGDGAPSPLLALIVNAECLHWATAVIARSETTGNFPSEGAHAVDKHKRTRTCTRTRTLHTTLVVLLSHSPRPPARQRLLLPSFPLCRVRG